VKLPFCPFFVCLALPVSALLAQTAPTSTPDQTAVVEGNNAFAVQLYSQLRNQNGNLFFSPESISTALAMTYAGARGDTASQMADTMQFRLPPERLHPAMGALLNDLNAAHDGYQLRVADALWVEKDYSLLDAFLKLNKTNYGAGLNQVDFRTAPDAARSTINQWVEQKTENKIKDLLPPGLIDPTTRLVLTNAIYFKGDWQTPFAKATTDDQDFLLSPEQKIKTPMMHREGRFNYFNGGTFQALEIPYKGAELSMIVLLTNNVGGLPALERSLTAYSVRQWMGQLRPASNVILTLPKFKMESRFSLGDTLEAMGMEEAFDRNTADFTGMASRKEMQRDGGSLGGGPHSGNLYIGAVIHKAYVDVDEEGTEAAAATAVVMHATKGASRQASPPPIIFCADHPFAFLIRDNRSGGILFMGRVTNPGTRRQNPSPGNPTPAPDVAPGQQKTPTTYAQRDAEYVEAQQKLLQGAENVTSWQDWSTAGVVRPYPFLSGTLQGASAVRIAESRGGRTDDVAVRENILFVYKLGGPFPYGDGYCGHDGCSLDVYVDDGTGYKKAVGWEYAGSVIHVSRANGQIALLIPVEHFVVYGGAVHLAKATDAKGPQNEWFLKANSFVRKTRPFPPDCCGPRRTRQ
jgi:serpin B